jgi:MFS family permease
VAPSSPVCCPSGAAGRSLRPEAQGRAPSPPMSTCCCCRRWHQRSATSGSAHGVGLGASALGLAMATSMAPRDQTGRAVGQVQAAQILSAAIGPLAGGVLADLVGIRWTFVATAGLCALALILLSAYYQEAPPGARTDRDLPRPPFAATLRLAGGPVLLRVLFLVNFVGRSITPNLPRHVHTLGVRGSLATFHWHPDLRHSGRRPVGHPVGQSQSNLLAAKAAHPGLIRRRRHRSPHGPGAELFGALLTLAVALGLASGRSPLLHHGSLMVPASNEPPPSASSAAALFGGSISPLAAGAFHFACAASTTSTPCSSWPPPCSPSVPPGPRPLTPSPPPRVR